MTAKPTTKRAMTAGAYVRLRAVWLAEERRRWEFLDLIRDEKARGRYLWNADEVPVVLEGGMIKQVVAAGTEMVNPPESDLTFDPSKRFATLLIFVSADVETLRACRIYPVLLMRGLWEKKSVCGRKTVVCVGSPSHQERLRYPPSMKVICNKKAWMNGNSWTESMRYFVMKTRRPREGAETSILYVDNLSTHDNVCF